MFSNSVCVIDDIIYLLKHDILHKLAEYYYKGIDIVVDGKDWSQRLTLCEIAEVVEQSKSTVHRKLRAFDSYVVSQLSNLENINI